MEWKEIREETNHETLWTLGNKQGGICVMDIKVGMFWDEHWLLYATNNC